MLQPNEQNFANNRKAAIAGWPRGSNVSFGDFGLQCTGRGRLTARQIEAARRAINRYVKRGGRVWIRVFPDKPVSKKPLEVRMEKGRATLSTGSRWCNQAPCSMKSRA